MLSTSRRLRLAVAATMMAGLLAACSDDGTSTPTPPAAPTGVTATATSPTAIRVTWAQVSNASSYELDRATGAGAFATIQSALTGTFFDDSGLQSDTDYRYQVRAVLAGTGGGSAIKSANSAVATARTQVQGPKLATVTGIPLSRTFYADTTYVLSGFVKVANQAVLTIQPGTRIVGDTLVPGSSLWILRGSRIDAQGTAAAPIVFTSQRSAGNRKPGDWGGIIIIGNAPINRTASPIFTEGPTGAAENYAGGTNFNDNSGTLKYVRVEFAGFDVSNGGGQELNSISSYAVGRGTTYDYVQSMAGLDDSFEFWGGGADIRHMVSFEAGDDHFDWTEGYQGRGQYLIALQTSVIPPRPGTGTVSSDPRGFEGDGCENDKAGCTYANTPYSMPVWANFTLVGPGTGVFSTTDGNGAVVRRGSAGTFVNGIIARWPGVGVSIRDAESGALMTPDSLYFRNILLVENGSNFEATASGRFGDRLSPERGRLEHHYRHGSRAIFSGALPTSTTTVTAANANLKPAAGSAAATGGLATFGAPITGRVQNFFGAAMPGTAYLGAVDPAGTPWYDGWTNWVRN